MVIHSDSEAPDELSTMKPVTQNFSTLQREFNETCIKASAMSADPAVLKKQLHKKAKKTINTRTPSMTSEENSSITEICAEDLAQLRTVYKQCKLVLNKMEAKYGHLLDMDTSENFAIEGPSKKRRKEAEDNECQCTLNKKIVFDDEGKEVSIATPPSIHICPQKLMFQRNGTAVTHFENKNIQIEYHSNDTELSDNLEELQQILENTNIETTYRNLVINKIKSIKQEFSNEIRFNKHSIIEKLKTNPDEIFNFNGANLSNLKGYAY